MSNNNQILNVYKSRNNILDILKLQGYDISDYETFSINEIDAMLNNNQLDMLIENPDTKQKSYIKYYSSKQIRPNILDEIIEDLYYIDNILEKKDNLIIITDDEPNDSILTKVKYLFDHDGIFVIIHNIKRLQYNMLQHNLVPTCNVLTNDEKELFMKKYNIKNNSQIPEISRFDPQALVMCIRPGDVTKFTRKSITSLESDYYRVCV
uniref:RNA polymerase subunit H/Rpb5 C-terminal domain-containing protein n=1 Tax=viral metagenome TaxID=1070528 RepID=A0A6C0FB33_9ZZZZ|tara:strand:- start:3332 stop:3955 length:624 start_codon:yes stop_codon:yes gene_type:complete